MISENHRNNTVHFYRSKTWKKVERGDEKLKRLVQLRSLRVSHACRRHSHTFESIARDVELPIRVVERSGDILKGMVVKLNLLKRKRCEFCQLDRKCEVNSNVRELVYKLICHVMIRWRDMWHLNNL